MLDTEHCRLVWRDDPLSRTPFTPADRARPFGGMSRRNAGKSPAGANTRLDHVL